MSKSEMSDIGPLETVPQVDLLALLKKENDEIKKLEKEIERKGCYLTAAKYRRGKILLELKRRSKHGEFGKLLKARKISPKRASEDMRIATYFPSQEEAGKQSVPVALKAIKRDPQSYTDYENCYAAPKWVREAIVRDYGFPGLDPCCSHGMEFGEKFFTPQEDGLKQDWAAECGGKIVWMNYQATDGR